MPDKISKSDVAAQIKQLENFDAECERSIQEISRKRVETQDKIKLYREFLENWPTGSPEEVPIIPHRTEEQDGFLQMQGKSFNEVVLDYILPYAENGQVRVKTQQTIKDLAMPVTKLPAEKLKGFQNMPQRLYKLVSDGKLASVKFGRSKFPYYALPDWITKENGKLTLKKEYAPTETINDSEVTIILGR